MLQIAEIMLSQQNYALTAEGKSALVDYIARRRQQPHFSNARSIRNALDRARLRQANRLFQSSKGPVDAEQLSAIDGPDIRSSRVFDQASGDEG